MNLSEMMHFIEQKLHAQISLEVLHPVFYECEALKLTPDQYIHHSPFCFRNKTSDRNITCSASKRECIRRGRDTALPFCRICPFGLREIVFPIRIEGETAALLFCELPDGMDSAVVRRHARLPADWMRLELEKLHRYGKFRKKQKTGDFYAECARNYIDTHYSENIALTDLADFLQVNPNYLGPLLKSGQNMNFHALLTERRIREAKTLLRFHSTLNIEQISARCGFSDSNYFSTVFRKTCGMSPRAYRKNPEEKEKEPSAGTDDRAGRKRG